MLPCFGCCALGDVVAGPRAKVVVNGVALGEEVRVRQSGSLGGKSSFAVYEVGQTKSPVLVIEDMLPGHKLRQLLRRGRPQRFNAIIRDWPSEKGEPPGLHINESSGWRVAWDGVGVGYPGVRHDLDNPAEDFSFYANEVTTKAAGLAREVFGRRLLSPVRTLVSNDAGGLSIHDGRRSR
jgi:hypothetical protein